jgi:serine/threonine protein kinase
MFVYVEFGFIDVRTTNYFTVQRFDLMVPAQRLGCFRLAINYFRLFVSMAPHIPQNPVPQFNYPPNGIEFRANHVLKVISASHTCPEGLYDLLSTGSVPGAVKVEKFRTKKKLKISPLGIRISDLGGEFSISQVKCAITCILRCLVFLHSRDFVHRDLRWPNLIAVHTCGESGEITDTSYLVIDFEFAGAAGGEISTSTLPLQDIYTDLRL